MHCCVLAFVLEKLVFSSAFTQCLFLQFTILEHTSGPFVQLVTFCKVSTGTTVKAGCIKLKKLSAVNRTHSLKNTKTATTRISGAPLTTLGSARAKEKITMWLDSTKQTATHWAALRS